MVACFYYKRQLEGYFVNIIDISWPITEDMTAYKDKSVVSLKMIKDFPADNVRESLVTLGTHTGTHVDAPSHFLEAGVSIDKTPLSATVGQCVVLDMTHCVESISRQDFQAVAHLCVSGAILLCKTRNSKSLPTDRFDAGFVYITADAALYLVERGIRTIGIDYLGIERNQKEHETHILFMQNGIVIIEGLRLDHVTPGAYLVCCLPLALVGTDGAPARTVLLTD